MLTIRNLARQEMVFSVEVAHKEGWNPGLYDGASFYQADPDGFFLAELDGGMAGGISAVKYGSGLAVIGSHFVLPPFRGRGIGKKLWEHALDVAGDRSIRINGLTEKKGFYTSYGFRSAGIVLRYRGDVFAEARSGENVRSAYDVDFRALIAYDAGIFGVARAAFLKAWMETPGMQCLCVVQDEAIRGWGCMRRCRDGWRLGPVFADHHDGAEELLRHFALKTIGERAYIDVPESNAHAIRLAFSMGMTPSDARMRLYRGPGMDEPMDSVFGFTTLDIG